MKFILTKKFISATIFLKGLAKFKKMIKKLYLVYTMAYRSVNNLVNICNGQTGCSSELLYRTSYTKEA